MTVLVANGIDSQVINPTRVLKYPSSSSSAVIAPLRTSAPGLVQLRSCCYSVHLTLLHHTRDLPRYLGFFSLVSLSLLRALMSPVKRLIIQLVFVVTRAQCWVGWWGPVYVGDGEVRAGNRLSWPSNFCHYATPSQRAAPRAIASSRTPLATHNLPPVIFPFLEFSNFLLAFLLYLSATTLLRLSEFKK